MTSQVITSTLNLNWNGRIYTDTRIVLINTLTGARCFVGASCPIRLHIDTFEF